MDQRGHEMDNETKLHEMKLNGMEWHEMGGNERKCNAWMDYKESVTGCLSIVNE